ncbi:MAG TPA: hypothetical protein VEB68_04645 [Croceibacterium sp.]|nr:hypothetical protein [Croceibacterium sp.]
MPRKLKVFRTPTGFHDAYVAAPSRKAALAAWGSDADLFARGVAEEVTDPALMAEPLRHPGEVIRLSRGDLATQLKALGPRKKAARRQERSDEPARAANARKPPTPKPPPRRDKVDAAEAALTQARRRHETEAGKLEDQRDAIERKLAALRTRQGKETARLERKRDEAREAYREALEKWSE